MNARLVCRRMGESDLKFPVSDSATTTIGRDVGNMVQLTASEVSKKHAIIRPHKDEWSIEDCGSKNGLFVNGEKLDRHVLRHGDVIRVGPYLLQFQTDVDTEGWIPDHVIEVSTQACARTMLGKVPPPAKPTA